jgi:predicted porin
VKKTFITAAAILAFTAAGHADELSDIQAQAKQLREQMTKRLADLEKRQKALESQKPVVINPVDAMAADLPYKAAIKARPVENDDLCIKGICVYGNFDVGIMYMTHTSPYNATAASPLDYLPAKNAAGSYFGFNDNQMSVSFIGLRGKQEVADNLYVVFNLQTQFNAGSGMNTSGTGSVAQNNGLTGNLTAQTSGNDSPRAGQMFNSAEYFGISSPIYGTVTMGRQSALSSDLVANYDSVGGANSWSVLTFQGANAGGGDTENRTYDNSYEYRVNVGPVRLAAEAQLRNGGNSGTGNAFEGSIGFDYMGFSMDFLGGHVSDAISAAPLSVGVNTSVALGYGQLGVTVSDNTFFQVGAKYTIGPWKFYGGYERIDYADPNNPLANGAFLEGGYIAGSVNNSNYINDKILQTAWIGVRYSITPALDIAGAYYHEWQNSFATGANTGCTTAISSQCSGNLDAVSLVVDWRFARHMDVYAGGMWSQVTNGMASGFLQANGLPNGSINPSGTGNRATNFDPGVGLRYQF